MDWFWNCGGECFGYRDGESLFTYFGKEAGRFDGEESNPYEEVHYFNRGLYTLVQGNALESEKLYGDAIAKCSYESLIAAEAELRKILDCISLDARVDSIVGMFENTRNEKVKAAQL